MATIDPETGRPRNVVRMFHEQGGRCHYCGCAMTLPRQEPGKQTPDYATKDHVIPASKGGYGLRNNKVLACNACNTERGNTSYVDFKQWKQEGRKYGNIGS